MTVEPGVSLELLDWGGSGRSIILLAGSGNTGHVFDEFAPKLFDCCHVYAITRRGYGASSRPADGYGWQRLAEDVFQVIEREHIPSPILVGHSMSGGEMTAVGHEHSDRLGGIVYLDALGDMEDDPPADKQWAEAQAGLPPGVPPAPPPCAQNWPTSACQGGRFDEWYFFRRAPPMLDLSAFCNYAVSLEDARSLAFPGGVDLEQQLRRYEPELVIGEGEHLFVLARDEATAGALDSIVGS